METHFTHWLQSKYMYVCLFTHMPIRITWILAYTMDFFMLLVVHSLWTQQQ